MCSHQVLNSFIGPAVPVGADLCLCSGSTSVVRPASGGSVCTVWAHRVKVTHVLGSGACSQHWSLLVNSAICAGITGMAGDYLGGEGYWAGGLHLYTPLPFRPGRGGFGDLFRTHFFLNAGNLCNLNYGERKRLFYGPELMVQFCLADSGVKWTSSC